MLGSFTKVYDDGNYSEYAKIVKNKDVRAETGKWFRELGLDEYFICLATQLVSSFPWQTDSLTGLESIISDSGKRIAFLKDDYCYILSEAINYIFIAFLRDEGIAFQWQDKYMNSALAQTGIIEPTQIPLKPYTSTFMLGGEVWEYICIKKNKLHIDR